MMHTIDRVPVMHQIERFALRDLRHPLVPELPPDRVHLGLELGGEVQPAAVHMDAVRVQQPQSTAGVRIRDDDQVPRDGRRHNGLSRTHYAIARNTEKASNVGTWPLASS